MFIELMPLLGERTVMLTVARIDKNRIRVNVIPTRKREDENAALCAPLSFSGTPEEVDGEMARNLGCVRRGNLRLQHTLEEAKAEMDAGRRQHVSGKAGQAAKKTELQGGGQQTDSTGTEAPADQENPPLLPACRQSAQNPLS
jgi:PRTRC genetic system protein E